MKFKSKAIPKPSEGVKYTDKSLVLPDQSLSLKTILERFTRNEPLPIGRDVSYHESDDDLEKVSNMDLVDKQEFIDKLKETRSNFDKQEKKKAANERKRLEKLAVDKIAAEQKQQGVPPDPAK